MARTKQTARISYGGKAPRKQMAYKNKRGYYSDSDAEPEPEPVDDSLAPLMSVETKYLEKRYDANLFQYTIEAGAPPKKSDNPDRWGMSVLVVTTYFKEDAAGGVSHRTLMVKSPYVRRLLQTVIGEKWSGVTFRSSMEEIDYPLECFWHYYDKLVAGAAKIEEEGGANQAEILHVKFFMKFIEEEFKDIKEEVEKNLKIGVMSYKLLWTIFKPSCLVYTTIRGHPQIMTMVKLHHTSESSRHDLSVRASRTDYDGTNMGTSERSVTIRPYFGTRKIEKLEIFPFEYHSRESFLRDRLILRGKKFEALQNVHYMQFKGNAVTKNGTVTAFPDSKRVVIDVFKFQPSVTVVSYQGNRDDDYYDDEDNDYNNNNNNDNEDDFMDYDAVEDMAPGKEEDQVFELTDEQRLQCPPTIGGFMFDEKMWYYFPIEQLSDVEWDPTAFDSLVIPQQQKNLVRDVVESHLTAKGCFDDFVPGKGKGLIMVIHGPPGVGKTLTAESLSDVVKKPLYSISSGELGTEITTLESNLKRILDLAARWDCVLLLDEADVFLEARSRQDIARNALVAVFLRLLERYPGILFLTSNRVSSFDAAFQSRIHIALQYKELDAESRFEIWRNFVRRVGEDKCDLTEADLHALSKRSINGREIKNCVRIARGLSERKGERMGIKHLLPVLELAERFDDGMKEDPK